MKDELEFDVETLEISEGRKLYLYRFLNASGVVEKGEMRRASWETDDAEGRQSKDDAPA